MLRALNSQEQIRPVKWWQTSIHSPVQGTARLLIVLLLLMWRQGEPEADAPDVSQWCFVQRPVKEWIHVYSTSQHSDSRKKKVFEMWQGGLSVRWIGSPWCQPSDDSHVDEVNFIHFTHGCNFFFETLRHTLPVFQLRTVGSSQLIFNNMSSTFKIFNITAPKSSSDFLQLFWQSSITPPKCSCMTWATFYINVYITWFVDCSKMTLILCSCIPRVNSKIMREKRFSMQWFKVFWSDVAIPSLF